MTDRLADIEAMDYCTEFGLIPGCTWQTIGGSPRAC